MQSPILTLRDAIAASAFAIAPERANDLAKNAALERFHLVSSNKRGFTIGVDMKNHEAILPVAALEFLWCCAYAFPIFHDEYAKAQQSGSTHLNLHAVPRTQGAITLLNWALNNMNQSGNEPWPENVPVPNDHPPSGSDEHVANELFLCAIAWIIHHEIAHVLLNHMRSSASYAIQQEKEADLNATDWILSSSSGPLPLERMKRTLGIVTAILAIQIIDRPGASVSCVRTHPPSVVRLDYCLDRAAVLDNDMICAYATIVLQIHLEKCGISTGLDGTSIRDILRKFMVAFTTHGRS